MQKIHNITYSMADNLFYYYLKNHSLENQGKVVMMAPPNKVT